MAARRWKCARCGAGRNAPGRMAQDDVRRYCLPCSEATGKLVQMECPALERRRAEKRKATNAKARRDREREAQRTYVLKDGTDARDVLRRVQALRCWKREGPAAHRAVRKIRAEKLVHVAFNAALDTCTGDETALRIIRVAALAAVQSMPRTQRMKDPLGGLKRVALCEYFGVDEQDVLETYRMTVKLLEPVQRRTYQFDNAVLQRYHAEQANGGKL